MTQPLPRQAPVARHALEGRRAVLVIAHPGHELRVHGWLERTRPTVCVLTDGSGHGAASRLASTSALVARADARPGPVYGGLSDRAFYAAVLRREVGLFVDLAARLAQVLVVEDADYVVGDALEGYNPAHDLCRVLIETAIELAGRRATSFDFPLTGPPDACPAALPSPPVRLTLDDAAFARKVAAARAYPELASEVNAAVSCLTPEAFRYECLRPVLPTAACGAPAEIPPYYETYGEKQVAAGRYAQVLRWRDHMAPLIGALRAQLNLPGR